MLGAIIGDMVGSTREWHNVKTEDFEWLPYGSRFTDDTVMTLAVAEWLMTDPYHREETLVDCMQKLGRRYMDVGYGKMFRRWLLSDSPQPYHSFGNGSAMRVSPVGLYASTLEEALELARISASVTHDHPEGIKGAQAIAACVYLRKAGRNEEEIKKYVVQEFGYDLDIRLEDIRDHYTFDVTCQGSVPIAIMAFLQRGMAESALRLAISMGGDSDTIGAMTCAIATACRLDCRLPSSEMPDEVIEGCRSLLPSDLLEINDRFEAFVSKPLDQSYRVCHAGIVFAGEYPGDRSGKVARQRINRMVHFGIRHFIDLTEEHELVPYNQWLPEGVTYDRFPVRDCGAPDSLEKVHRLLTRIDELAATGGYVYIHCWGGVGRTGTVVACLLAHEEAEPQFGTVLKKLRRLFAQMPKSAYRTTPESEEQLDFIRRFVDDCSRKFE